MLSIFTMHLGNVDSTKGSWTFISASAFNPFKYVYRKIWFHRHKYEKRRCVLVDFSDNCAYSFIFY
jgi:hypothetical protein